MKNEEQPEDDSPEDDSAEARVQRAQQLRDQIAKLKRGSLAAANDNTQSSPGETPREFTDQAAAEELSKEGE